MPSAKVNLRQELSLFSELWSAKIVAEVSDPHVKLVKRQGSFVWHAHEQQEPE